MSSREMSVEIDNDEDPYVQQERSKINTEKQISESNKEICKKIKELNIIELNTDRHIEKIK